MLELTCIEKIYKNSNSKQIIACRLQDTQGNVKDVDINQLKLAMMNEQVFVNNLKLTSDYRLIDIAPIKIQHQQETDEQQIKNMMLKAQVLGFSVKEIAVAFNNKCYLISQSDKEHTLYIPNDVISLTGNTQGQTLFNNIISHTHGNIKVVGGHNLMETCEMFYSCDIDCLDLTSFDTSNVDNMNYMFGDTIIKEIKFSPLFKTSKVYNMNFMFHNCRTSTLNLIYFNTINVVSMNNMFLDCKVESINLSSFNTINVKCMGSMFQGCTAEYLDLSSFKTKNLRNMEHMFYGCKAKEIKMTSSKIRPDTIRYGLFEYCETRKFVTNDKLLLDAFYISKGINYNNAITL